MPHIHTQPNQHDHTVSAYIVRTDGDKPQILLHMHKKLGMLLPVGGHIELEETPWLAIAHELEEEAGYEIKDLAIMQPHLRIKQAGFEHIIVHPQPFLMNTHHVVNEHYHSDTGYLFLASGDPSKQLADGESNDLRWLTRQEIDELAKEDVWQSTRLTCLGIFDSFINEWQSIPAAEFRTDKTR
jgi:8-oxo-dGTP diphosphatase